MSDVVGIPLNFLVFFLLFLMFSSIFMKNEIRFFCILVNMLCLNINLKPRLVL